MSLSRRFYAPRCIGLGLGFLAVFFSLSRQHMYWQVLAMLLMYCFGWPHLAYLAARASARPVDAERRSMLVDALAAGFFAGAIGFSLIPSVAIVIMVTMNNMTMGGPRFMTSGAAASLAGAALAYLVVGTPLDHALDHVRIAACVPLLVLYPLSLGYVCHRNAVKLVEQKKQLGLMSRTDSLTGLANRAAFNETLDAWVGAPETSVRDSVLALVDVDEFKQINDRHGHLAGDRALQAVADIMRACVRDQDLVGRYGGDEFCILLRHVGQAEAARILERMRALAQRRQGGPGGQGLPTLSIGAARYTPDAGAPALWIHRADEAMYEAKRSGRNRVVFAA